MRQQTATEKFRAVQEGKMAKGEFVRQMRQQFPDFISQFNGFDDSVQILKNKGLVFEAKAEKKPTKTKSYDERPALTYSLDALDRGIRIELQAAGLMPHMNLNADDFFKAEKKAKDNLEKNPSHYINLVGNESDKVNKNDQMVPVDKKNNVDTFNGMKKATLKEAYKPGDKYSKNFDYGGMVKAAMAIPEVDPGKGATGEEVEHMMKIYNSLEDVNYHTPNQDLSTAIDAFKHEDEEEGNKALKMFKKNLVNYIKETINKKDEEKEIEHDCANHVLHEKYGHGICLEGEHTLLEDGTVTHYDVFFKEGSKTVKNIPINELEVITSSHHGHKRKKNEEESIPYEEGKGKDHDGDGDIDSDDYMAAKDKAIKKAMGKDKEANEQFKPKRLKKITVGGKTYEKGELDPDDDGRILRIEKYPNGYFITGSTGREGYGYAIDLKGNEIDEDDLEGMDEVMNIDRKGKVKTDSPSNYTGGAADTRKVLKEVLASHIGKIKEKYGEIPGIDSLIKDYIKTHRNDIMDGDFEKDPIFYFDLFVDANYDRVDEEEIPSATLTRINTNVKNPKTMAQAILKFVDQVDDKEQPALFANPKLKRALEFLKDLADDQVVEPEGEIEENIPPDGTDIIMKDLVKADEVIKMIKMMHPDVKQDLLMRIAKMGQNMDEKQSAQLKEAIKGIIKKSLKEDMIEEAATNQLAKIADDYESFAGMKQSVIDLQNVVNDIESFYERTREKIQKVYDKLGEIKNDEGLKVGGFLAPAIETAFKKDLRPVMKNNFTGGLNLPNIKPVRSLPIAQEGPKKNIFGINEKKDK